MFNYQHQYFNVLPETTKGGILNTQEENTRHHRHPKKSIHNPTEKLAHQKKLCLDFKN